SASPKHPPEAALPGGMVLALLDHTHEMRPWLESQLIGENLWELVQELKTARAALGASTAPAELPRPLRERVARGGLAQATDAELRFLLAHPGLLCELQQAILTEGGSYWKRWLAKPAPRPRPWYANPIPWATHALAALAAG